MSSPPRTRRLGVVMYVPADLAGDGYAVAGVDVRGLFGSLPARGAARDSACARAIVGAVDCALLANGGVHARRFGIALAGLSLRRLTLARPVVEEALRWMLVGAPADAGQASRSLSPP